MKQNFGGVVWTNHALLRLKERGIKQSDAWAVWNNPDYSRYAKNKNAWIYFKTWDDTRIEIVAKQNEEKKWIILSVWSKKIATIKKEKGKSSWDMLLDLIFRRK